MKTRFVKRSFSILLCLIMLVSILPAHAHAAWEDGMECWHCTHYHWDEYCCGMCGACSIECTNAECFTATHCNECGKCFESTVFCLDCMACEECYVNEGWHCLGCGECKVDEQEELCGYCWFCEDCMGGLCDGCGFCESCWEVELMHCDECGNCYGTYEICAYDYLHCEECCVICEQCDECLYEDGIELCEDCGLCVYCCQDNAAAEGCECGEYCIENPEWYEHLCPDCGTAFCTAEICDLCELCLDCCEANSDCDEMPPVCVEDPDYDEHFCEDCGECFHATYVCESCEAAGTFLCENCCEIHLEAEGCDCTDRCISDSDIEAHIKNAHQNAGSHSASPQSTWEMNETQHWRACRFCGEASHIMGKASHTFDKYGICTVCGFDSQKVILILKQPSSTVAKVSDIHVGGEDDPLYPSNNKRAFTVAAKGTTALKYQWYVTYDGGTKWIELKDDSHPYASVEGAKTNTLTVSVPIDGCAYEYAYKCVITDQLGNQVTTNTAYLKITHAYRKYQKAQGELIGIINQPDSKNNIGMYASEGHYMVCVGEECDASKLVPHSFGKETRLIFDSKTGVGWHERTCIHCGFKSYLENHIHYFYDPQTYECEIDVTYKNENQHRLICLFPGCNRTHLESHEYMGWQNHGTPYSNADKVGIAYKECQICGYSSTKKTQTYDAAQDKMVDAAWNQSSDLVYVENGYSSCDIVIDNTKIVIGFAPSEYAKKELLQMDFPKVTRWKVRYYCDRGASGSAVDMDVTQYFTFEKVADELKWTTTIPSFPGHTGGGILTFTPIIEPCKHESGTRIKNASQPICTQDGYTGDTVCADCDGVLFYGETIESIGKHEGNLTLIPGTSKEGTCETRGYEGTYRCDHCNKTVRGKTTSKAHNKGTVLKNAVAFTCTKFGYSGDLYCECGVLLKEGEITAPRHTDLRLINQSRATCQKKGYTGDWMCYDCNQIVKYGYSNTKSEHAWSKWGKINDIYHRHTCVVAGCGAQETSRHTDGNRDLTCDDCAYSWGSDSPVVRSITFNIDIPVIGQKPDYTKFDGTCYYSDGVSAYRKNGVEWFDVTANKRFVPGGVNQEFQEGHVYKVTIHFRVKTEYEFIEESALLATINGRGANVEYVTYGEFAGISYTFEALQHVHTMKRVDKVTPTCTTAGKNTYYHCTSCNNYYEDAAGKTQITNLASWGNLAANGHKASELKSNSTHHFKVCTVCYAEIAGSKAAHSGGTATCLAKAKCKDCGTSYGDFAGHQLTTADWGFIDGAGHAHVCSVQGCSHRSEVKPHRSGGAATESSDEICLDCGYVITLAANHTHVAVEGYENDGQSHWQVCGCGAIMEKKNHINNNDDTACDVCGYTLSGNAPDSTGPSGETTPDSTGPAEETSPDNTGPAEATSPDTTAPGEGTGTDDKADGSAVIWIILILVLAAGAGAAFVILKKKKLWIFAGTVPQEEPESGEATEQDPPQP